jgi:heme-degrading monooxygenase HmoA
MFAVLFEVNPRGDQRDTYLDLARMLRPGLERIDGFVENIRYRSLTRESWILSLSTWESEKALVRWRTQAMHHAVQERGRSEVFRDYHLRVGQLTRDTELPGGSRLIEQRLGETEVGEGTAVTMTTVRLSEEEIGARSPVDIAAALGLALDAPGLVSWDVLDAVLSPGEVILLMTWRDGSAADVYAGGGMVPDGVRTRQVRVVRDYGMYDRRESPQYYPEVGRG